VSIPCFLLKITSFQVQEKTKRNLILKAKLDKKSKIYGLINIYIFRENLTYPLYSLCFQPISSLNLICMGNLKVINLYSKTKN
jgi:hypothetical protein